MKVQGCDCSIVIKTAYQEMDVPYSEETLREAISILQEEASIEGDGVNRAIQKRSGVTGCVVTPFSIDTAPLLLFLAMGSAGLPIYISETRNLYRHCLHLLPLENSTRFDIIQKRNNERLLYECCVVKGFELRVNREETVKMKIDISGEQAPVIYPYTEIPLTENTERFNGSNVSYKINGKTYSNIYGLTLLAKKEGGTKTELWIKRCLEAGGYATHGNDIPDVIDELIITAQLLRDKYVPSGCAPRGRIYGQPYGCPAVYEYRHFGLFRITLTRLVLVSDETIINSPDAVIGPMRYYVSGTVKAEVFTCGEDC